MSIITYNNIADNLKSLPVYFCTACDYHLQEAIIRPEGILEFHQILFVVDGRGVLRCNGNVYELKRGSAFFTAADVPVEYVNTGGLVTAFLTANGTAVTDLMKCFDNSGFLFYESVNIEKYVAEIRKIVKNYYEHKREGMLSALVYSLYMDFFEQQSKDVFTKLDEIALYIEQNFMKKLTLAQLADIGCFSVSKLCHDFKNKFNCTVFQYILNLRLIYAHQLLISDSQIMIKDAAFSCGFDDVSYFCHAYKAKFGISPAEDRKIILFS